MTGVSAADIASPYLGDDSLGIPQPSMTMRTALFSTAVIFRERCRVGAVHGLYRRVIREEAHVP